MAKEDKQSPLRRPPLRQAGQSVQEEMDRLWDQKIDFYFVTALVLCVLAVWDWCGWFFKTPRLPWLTTLMAVGYMVYAAIRVRSARKKYLLLKLGRDGERI